MATLSYNSISLDYIHTHKSEQEAEWSDDGTEYLRTKVTLSVQAVMSPPLLPSQSTQRPSVTMNQVRQQLLLPRQALLFTTSAADTLYNVYGSAVAVPPSGGQLDVNNGPRPVRCSIVSVKGTEAYLIDYEIVFYLIDCDGPDHVSHRWNESVSIDENGMSTITRMGKLVVRSDKVVNADAIRNLAVPPMRPGFRRTGMEFTVQQDGLALMYRITDTEEFIMPPPFATKAEGYFYLSCPINSYSTAEVHVTLQGPKNFKTSDILGKAITIAIRKLAGPGGRFKPPGPGNENLPVLWSRAIRQSLWENKVEVVMSAHYTAASLGVSGSPLSESLSEWDIHPQFALSPDRFCGSNDTLYDLGPGGSANLNLLVKALRNTPCSSTDSSYEFRTLGTSSGDAGVGPTPTDPATPPVVYVVAHIPELDSVLYGYPDPQDQGSGVYTNYLIESPYDTDLGVRELPTNGGPVYVSFQGPSTTRTLKWTATRVGNKPRILDYSADPNTVLLWSRISPESVSTDEGTLPVWTIKGEYRYGFLDPSQVLYQFPVPPWLDVTQLDNPYLEDEDLNDRIADPAFFARTPLPSLRTEDPDPFIGRVPN